MQYLNDGHVRRLTSRYGGHVKQIKPYEGERIISCLPRIKEHYCSCSRRVKHSTVVNRTPVGRKVLDPKKIQHDSYLPMCKKQMFCSSTGQSIGYVIIYT